MYIQVCQLDVEKSVQLMSLSMHGTVGLTIECQVECPRFSFMLRTRIPFTTQIKNTSLSNPREI